MTSLAAQRLGLYDRGRLEPDMAADVVVFDPATVLDTATYEEPRQFPVGIEYVLVNGEIAWRQGQTTGKRGGESHLEGTRE